MLALAAAAAALLHPVILRHGKRRFADDACQASTIAYGWRGIYRDSCFDQSAFDLVDGNISPV